MQKHRSRNRRYIDEDASSHNKNKNRQHKYVNIIYLFLLYFYIYILFSNVIFYGKRGEREREKRAASIWVDNIYIGILHVNV